MVEVLSWQRGPEIRATLARIVQLLQEGHSVAFPSESSYLVATSLASAQRTRLQAPQALALLGSVHALSLFPTLEAVPRRLLRRLWPGPVLFTWRQPPPDLPEQTQRLLAAIQATDSLSLCCPGHSAILHAIHELGEPLVVSRLPHAEAPLTTAELAMAHLPPGGAVVDAGPCPAVGRPTEILLEGERWQVIHEGLISTAQIQVHSSCLILFVCTGNTCRSPLAASLCRQKLAERLQCPVEDLPQRGFVILSAGVAAYEGEEASPEAVEVSHELGADLRQHVSQPLDRDLATQADHLLCMTQSHLQALHDLFPHLPGKARLLNVENVDLQDPIGQDLSVYRACAEQICRDLDGLLKELVPLPGSPSVEQ